MSEGMISAMELNALDRCDRCGAQAYVKATKGEASLLFCAHHGHEHVPALKEKGFTIHDETKRLAVPTPV
jgi:hypothetical protein